jgi:ankyrin repeat protein
MSSSSSSDLSSHEAAQVSPSSQRGVLVDLWNQISSWIFRPSPSSSESPANNIARSEEDEINALAQAACAGDEQEIRRLFETNIDMDVRVTSTGGTALYCACLNGHHAAVELLLGVGADPTITDYDGTAPIHVAAYNSSESEGAGRLYCEILETLVLEHGVGVDQRDGGGGTPLMMASLTGSCEALKTLIRIGADPLNANDNGETALYLAAQEGHNDIVSVLIQDDDGVGGELDVATTSGWWTPLYASAQHNQLSTAQLLMTSGADVNLADKDGNTPLHVASTQGFTSMCALLCEHGACSNAQNHEGDSPVLMATKDGHDDTIRLLVQTHGADPNTPDHEGYTPVFVAAQEGHDSTIRLLVAGLGADPAVQTSTGATPMDAALQQGNTSALAVLTELTTTEGGQRREASP